MLILLDILLVASIWPFLNCAFWFIVFDTKLLSIPPTRTLHYRFFDLVFIIEPLIFTQSPPLLEHFFGADSALKRLATPLFILGRWRSMFPSSEATLCPFAFVMITHTLLFYSRAQMAFSGRWRAPLSFPVFSSKLLGIFLVPTPQWFLIRSR